MNALVKALACAAAVVATPASATNILSNPGFESGSLGPWYEGNVFSSGVSWFVTDADARSGSFSAEDTGNRELRQDFAGVLGSSIDEVSFWARHPVEGTEVFLAYDFFYSDNTSAEFLVSLVGTDWNFFDVTAQLDTTKTLVGFSIYGNSDGANPVTRADDFLIDVADRGVPEPATWAMMVLGFGLAGAALRRHRKSAAALV